MSYIDRQNRLRELLDKKGLDAFLVRKKQNISYLTGVKGDDAKLFISRKRNILFTDSRYEEEYKKTASHCSVRSVKNISACIEEACRGTHSRKIGFEANNFTYSEYLTLKKCLRNKRLIHLKDTIENLRSIKDKGEIGHIRKACLSAAKLMNHATTIIRPGLKENRVKAIIEGYAIRNGVGLAGFDIIVASGRNSSMPHAAASGKTMRQKEMVTIDLGTTCHGYNSDLTRTVFLGRINHKYSQIYNIVLDAQRKAIENIKPGICAADLDAVSRQYISDKGMGRYFLHSLGHGIGLETNEIPAISQNSKIRLAKGMAITVEPGIYIPGWGGVRIEDVVIITENGCEVLTSAVSYKP